MTARIDSEFAYRDFIAVECNYCGTPFRTLFGLLRGGHTKSCGCLRTKAAYRASVIAAKHGYHGTRIYHSWQSMWQRCTNPNATGYRNYGGRGIEIHPEWGLFDNFLQDMGERPRGKSLERINNNEGYEMNNCRWATAKEQRANQRLGDK